MTTTKAEQLAARLESGWCPIESPADMERAAAELRRLAALEVARDALQLDYARLLEKHNNLHANAARDRAERDALLAAIPEGCTPADAATLRAANHQLAAARDALLAAIPSPAPVHQPVHGWTDADADAARLALELECLLTDGDMPMPLTSRWWESAHEALALHRRRISDELREIECPPDPDAVDRALDADALRADAEQAQEAQQAAGQEQDERDAFEAWAISYSTIPLKRDDDASLGFTGYTEMDQTMLWDAWQARAALAQRREPLQDSTLWGMWGDSPSDVLAFARRIERHYGIGATTGQEPGNG